MKLRTSYILIVAIVLLSGCESEKKQLESKEQNVLFQKKVTNDWEVFITDKK